MAHGALPRGFGSSCFGLERACDDQHELVHRRFMYALYVATMDLRSRARRRTLRRVMVALLATLVSVARPVGAQASAPAELSLASALALAQRQSPLFERVEARYGIARGDVRTAGQWPNPTLEYRRENLGSPLLPDEFVTAYIPIDVTGRRVQLARATRRGTARALAERDAAQQDAALTIARAWVAAVLAAELAQVTAQQHEAADEIARLEAVRAGEGVSSEAAARRTRVEATRLAHLRALAEARAVQERGALATALGVPDTQLPALPLSRDGRSALASATVDASLRAALDTLSTLDLEALRARALADRAELRAASLAREEASFRQAVERGGVLGDWQLQGGSKLTGGFFTGQIGLAVPIPIFHRNGGARERSAGEVRDADALSRTTALAVEADVRAAHDALRRLRTLGTAAQESPADADVIADAARVAYAEGHMTLLELLDAQRAAADARTLARQYAADLLLARLTLARAVGAPILPGAPQ